MKRTIWLCALTVFVSVSVVGCGSDNAAPVVANVPGTDIPVTATTSSESASVFVKSIVLAGGLDTAEPITAGDVVLATSETEEPDPSI